MGGELLAALIRAKETIRALHGPNQWEIYDRCSPEMKAINAAIAQATTPDPPTLGGDEAEGGAKPKAPDAAEVVVPRTLPGWIAPLVATLDAFEADLGEPLDDMHELGRIYESSGSASFRIRVGHVRDLEILARAEQEGMA